MDSVKETLADRSLNAKLFSEADNRSGEHIDFRAFSDVDQSPEKFFMFQSTDQLARFFRIGKLRVFEKS